MLQTDASQTAATGSAAPDARNDVDALPSGSTGPETGNVITAVGTLSAPASADVIGNAPATIVAVSGEGGGSAELTPAAAGPMQVQGRYGTLTIDGEGNYSYVRNASAPECVTDIFTYTLADATGARDSATLTLVLGRDCGTVQGQQIVTTADGVVVLPAGVELSDIRVVGRDLVITLPDGSTMTIPNGAVFVPQLVIGDVEVPPANLAALLIDAEPKPAAGTPETLSSGGNFASDVPPLDPGVPLGDLLPPTELVFTPPVFEDIGQFVDREPETAPNPAVQLDDETRPNGIPGGTGDVSPDTANTSGVLAGSGGDGPLTWDLLTTGAPAGFAFVDGPNGSVLIQQNGVTVVTVTINAATGAYTVTQNAPIVHPSGGDENDVSFILNYTVTDNDGDFAPGTLTINVDDDSPAASATLLTATVDEDGVPGGIAGGTGDVAGEATVATGNVAALFNSGADTPLTYGLSSSTAGLPALTSNGVAVTYSVSGNTLTASAGGTTVFTFTVAANGNYTFTLLDQIDHPTLNGQSGDNTENDLTIALGSMIVATDRDGDPVTANANGLVVTIDDDTPVATQNAVSGTVDEDGVPGGIAGGPGDVAGESAVATGSVATLFASGADAPLSFSLLTGTSGLPALTSNGVAVTYAVNGNTLTASAGGNTVFTFVLNANGSYTFTLLDQLDHATLNGVEGDNTENDLTIDLSSIVQATDADGDSVTAGPRAILITVDDDTPTASTTQVTGTVDEDGVPGGIAGGPGDVAGESAVATGSVAAMFNSGADAPLSFSLSTNTSGLPTLTSNGVAVTYAVVGNTLTASAGGNTVFTFVLNANGSYTFTLVDQLDHPTLNGVEGDNTENDLSIALGSIILAADADGDSVAANANGLVITIDDDTPTASAAQVTGTVDEDGVPGGIAGGTGDVAGEATVATGSVATLFNSGADQPLTYSLLASTSGLPVLTSNGVAVTYQVVGSTLTASAGGNTVFTFVLNANGSWTFTLVDQLDHPTLNGVAGDNTENDLAIDLSSIIQATDADGDSVTANAGGLVVTVDDDTPANAGEPATIFVDEDAVLEGAADNGPGDGIAGGPNDGPGTLASGSTNITSHFSSGADQPLTFSMSTNTSGLPALTSGGVAVTYAVVGNTLTASAGGNTVFTIVLDPATGNVTFTLVDQLDHATLNGLAGDNTENNLQIDISSLFTATDADGDSIALDAGSVIVDVDDDTPQEAGPDVILKIDEDGLAGGNAGGPGDDTGGTSASFELSAMFRSGADEPLTYSLSTNTSGLPALSSGGVTLVYSVSGNTLTATAGAGGPTVFTMVVNPATGQATFTLFDQIDHPTLNGLTGDNSENNLIIDFSSIFQATDADGDTATLGAGSAQVDIDDDTPTATGAAVGGTVDEDGVVEGTADGGTGDGIAGGPAATGSFADVAGEATVATGSVTTLFSAGADQPLTYSLATNTSGLPALTSNGVAITYSVAGNLLTASAGGETVFTFSLNSGTGAWTFTLVDQIDHPTLNGLAGDNTENDLTIDLSAIIQATDFDGDTVTANAGGLVITVDDDTPVARNDTDGLTGGQTSTTGNVITGADTTSGVGGADSSGADAPITIVGLVGSATGDTDPTGGFSATGTHGTLQMDAQGNYTYTRTSTSAGTFQDVFTYTITDADGDTTTATLTINITDAAPVLTAPGPVQLDDDNAIGVTGNAGGPGDDDVSGTGGTLVATGGDGDVDFFFNGTQPAAPTGFSYNLVNSTTMQILQGSTVVATITLNNETGEYTVVQNAPVLHDTLNGETGDNTENNTPNFSIALVARDENGTGDSSNVVNLVINIDDDTPVLSNVAAGAGVTLDETDATPAGFPISATSASAAISATQAFGADGPAVSGSVVYGVTVVDANSGLQTAQGDFAITLVQVDADTIEGRYNGSNVAFTIQMNSNGTVTITQNVPLEHTLDGSSTEAHDDSLNLAGKINATITITDKDGDSTSASAPIGNLLVFEDDGPDAQTSGTAVGQVVLDETRPEGGDRGPGATAPNGTDSETIDFGANFVTGSAVDYGADGAGSVSYAFVLSGTSVGSGLYAIDGTDTSTTDSDGYGQGAEIMLSLSGNVISGKVGTTTYFTITLDPVTGIATFTQLLNIWHPTSGTASFDELVAITTAAASDIKVVQTVTDSDGDTDTAEINVGQGVFAIEDDGPQAIQPQEATVTNTAGQSDTDVPLDDDGSLAGDFGTDLPGKITFANITNGQDTLQKANNVTIELWLSADGQTLQGRTGSTDGTDGNLIYTVQIQPDGTYDFTLNAPIDNGSGVSFGDLSGGVAGNPPFKLIQSSTADALELLVTPINSTSVNSDNDDIAAGSQFIEFDTGIRFDFGDFTYVANGGGTSDDQWIIENNETVNGFKFTIDQISNGTVVDIRLTAYDADDDGGVAEGAINTGDPAGDPVDPITSIKLYDSSGVYLGEFSSDTVVNGVTIDFDTNLASPTYGSVAFENLPSDYSIQTYTANGYSRIEIYNEGTASPDGKFSVSFLQIETTQQGNPIDLFFDVAITDADGDTLVLDDAIHVNVDPVATTTSSTSSTMVVSQEAYDDGSSSLMAFDDSVGGKLNKMNAANTNTVFLGAIAAAGLVSSPAAASDLSSGFAVQSLDGFGEVGNVLGSALPTSTQEFARELLVKDLQQTVNDNADLPAAASRGEAVSSEAASLAGGQTGNLGAPAPLSQGTDTPGGDHSADASPVAQAVAMPPAEMLLAGANAGEGAAHTQEVGRVLADALAGGNGHAPGIDALLDAAAGPALGEAADAIASHVPAGVPAWDMGGFADFATRDAFSMEALLVHPDAGAAASAAS